MLGYMPGDVIGWVEKDGKAGISSDHEIAHALDQIEDEVTVHISCNNCTCTNGHLLCTNEVCHGCAYTQWSTWTGCSKSCNAGDRIRNRNRVTGKGEQSCNLATQESEDCNFIPCDETPSWSFWGLWEECSASCGMGHQMRMRTCNNAETYKKCIGKGHQIRPCKNVVCLDEKETCTGDKVWSDCANKCPLTCVDFRLGIDTCQEDDNCQPGCRCPDGMKEQLGECVGENECYCYDEYGNTVLENFETETHDLCQRCVCEHGSIVCVNNTENCCVYAEWTAWGGCSQTCGAGLQRRYRKLISKGSMCENEYLVENRTCTNGRCPFDCIVDKFGYNNNDLVREDACEVCYCQSALLKCYLQPRAKADGNWTEWSGWSGCSRSCSPGGVRSRTRSCSKPLPRCGGKMCKGNTIEFEQCNQNGNCCMYHPWSAWSACSQSCGAGVQTKTRKEAKFSSCSVPQLYTQQTCSIQPCNVNCGSWSVWSQCDGICNKGISKRVFQISPSKINNLLCKEITEVKSCDLEKQCQCDTSEEWSEAADCEYKCEEGMVPVNKTACESLKYGCKCKYGMFRAANGQCIEQDQCEITCNVEGTIKNANEIWTNPSDNCSKCECIGGQVKCTRICKVPSCSTGEELFYLESDPCCPVCRSKSQGQCQVKSMFVHLANITSNCQSVEKVKITYCSGKCGDSISMPALLTEKPVGDSHMMYENHCMCCQGKATKIKEVIAFCGPQQTETVMYYPQICSCECNRCS